MKKYRITLTPSEQAELRTGINQGKYKNTRLKRAQILLASDESEGGKGMKDAEIAKAYEVRVGTVECLRQRFVEEGYEVALQGKKGEVKRPPVFDSRVESKLISLRCSDPPAGNNKWSLRLLADKMVELSYVEQMSHESVRRILKKHRLSLGR